jgi:hypothetical protein
MTPQEMYILKDALHAQRLGATKLARINPDIGQLTDAEGPLATPVPPLADLPPAGTMRPQEMEDLKNALLATPGFISI